MLHTILRRRALALAVTAAAASASIAYAAGAPVLGAALGLLAVKLATQSRD
jgi:hypothetical protein